MPGKESITMHFGCAKSMWTVCSPSRWRHSDSWVSTHLLEGDSQGCNTFSGKSLQEHHFHNLNRISLFNPDGILPITAQVIPLSDVATSHLMQLPYLHTMEICSSLPMQLVPPISTTLQLLKIQA